MKILLIALLCASLTANALLFVQTSRSHSDSPAVLAATASTSGAALPLAAPATTSELLGQLRADDPATLRKLRALGVSGKVIQVLAEAAVDRQFRGREHALDKRDAQPFWKKGFHGYDPARYAAMVDLRRDKETALRNLLGDDYHPEPTRNDFVAGLPPEKAFRIRQMEEDYNAMSVGSNTYSNYGVFIQFPEDVEKQAYLKNEKHKELAEILTPDELFEYDLRSSRTASSMRFQLAAFQPTEEEFRQIFKIRQAAELQGKGDPSAGRGILVSRAGLDAELDPSIKAVLGDDRFAQYKRAEEPDYRRFYQIAARLDLPQQSVEEAQTLKTSIEDQRKKLLADPAAQDPAVRSERLEALSHDAETGLRRILGDTGYETYRQTPGNFFQRLKPPVITRPKKG